MTPPDFWQALGLTILETDADGAVVEMEVPDWLMSPFGAVHGGALAMFFDTALAVAVVRGLDGPEDRVATHQLTVSYAAFTGARRLRCRARIVRLARTVAIAEGEITDPAGTLVAKALATFGVRRRDP